MNCGELAKEARGRRREGGRGGGGYRRGFMTSSSEGCRVSSPGETLCPTAYLISFSFLSGRAGGEVQRADRASDEIEEKKEKKKR